MADCHPLHKQPSSSGFWGTELLQFPVSIEVPRYRNVIQCLRACSLHLDVKRQILIGSAPARGGPRLVQVWCRGTFDKEV